MGWSDEELAAAYYGKQAQQSPVPTPTVAAAPQWTDDDLAKAYYSAQQPTVLSEAQNVGGRFLKGAAQMAGLGVDAMRGVSGMGVDYMLGKTPFGTGQQYVDYLTEAGIPMEPKTRAGRLAGTVAEYLPGAAIPGGGLAMRLGAAATSGLGAGVARELAPNNALAEIAGSLVGGAPAPIGRAIGKGSANLVRTLSRLFSKEAPEEAVAQVIRAELGPQGTAKALTALGQYAPGGDDLSKLTTAEVTRSPLIAALQGELPRTNDEATKVFSELAARRDVARQALIRSEVPEALMNPQPEVVGETLRAALKAEREPLAEEAQRLFQQIDPTGTTAVPLKPVRDTYRELSEALIEPRGQPLRGDAASAVEELFRPVATENSVTLYGAKGEKLAHAAKFPETETFKGMSQLRQRFLDAGAGAQKQSQNQAAAVMKALAASVDNSIANAAEKAVGFTPEQKDLMQQARKAWKALKETYDEGAVGSVLKQNEYGRSTVLGSAVPMKLFGSPEAAQQTATALRANEEALIPLRGYVATQMAGKTPSQFRAYLKHETRLKTILGEKHFTNLQRVADSMDTEEIVRSLFTGPSKGQSLTAQSIKKNTAEILKASAIQSLGIVASPQLNKAATTVGGGLGYTSGGWLGGFIGASAGGWLGEKGINAQKAFITRVDAALLNLALDPEYARALLAKPSRKSIERAAPEFLKQFPRAEGVALMNAIKANLPNDQKKNETGSPMKQRVEDSAADLKTAAPDTELEKLVNAIIQVESAGNPSAISRAGAKGLMQLMDPTGKEWHAAFGLETPYNPFDPEFNRRAGTAEISRLLKKYGNKDLALAAYNWGQGKIDRLLSQTKNAEFAKLEDRLPSETKEYVRKVRRARSALG